jgi:hypothetical protein
MRDGSIARNETVTRSIRAIVVALVVCAVGCGPAFAQAGYAGRATESDYAQLARDVARVGVVEREFNRRRDGQGSLIAQDRQWQLLGVDDNGALLQRATSLQEWWRQNALQPALDVAANPAASCALARYVLKRLLELEQQAQVLGLENPAFLSLGDSDGNFARAIRTATKRCVEEAFDECMATGNGQVFLDLLVEWQQQTEFAMMELEADWQQRVAYLFRRCTVYRFIYHLDLEHTGAEPNSGMADGTFTLLFEFGEEGDNAYGIKSGVWSAPRPQDQLYPDILLSGLDCGPDTVACVIENSPMGGLVRGQIFIKRYMRQQTISVDNERAEDRMFGGRLVVVTERRDTGRDELNLIFHPPLQSAQGRYREGFGELYTLGGPGTHIYVMAVGGTVTPKITEWRRDGYPVLFTANPQASSDLDSMRGYYRIVHRPDLFPPEEINTHYEVVRPAVAEPPRAPLR